MKELAGKTSLSRGLRVSVSFLLVVCGLVSGCREEGQIEAGSQVLDLIAMTCLESDQFRVEDIRAVITADDLGLPAGRSIADSCAVELDDGRVRLYYFAQKVGISCAISEDGIHFTPEAGGLLHEGYSMPRVVRLEDGQFRMFVSDWKGVWSAISVDGVSFILEEGLRLTTEESGFDRIGKFTIMALAEGGYRAYLHQLSIPGTSTPTIHYVRSAVSSDQLTWVMEEGIRIGGGADVLDDPSREPFPLVRGEGGVTLVYTNVAKLPTTLYTSTSLDGVNFTEAYPLGLDGAGPFVLRLLQGETLLYYDGHDESLGYHVRVARIELD